MPRTELKAVCSLLNEMIKSMLDLKERCLQDALSMFFVKMNVFPILIKSLVQVPCEDLNYSHTARVFELCACH